MTSESKNDHGAKAKHGVRRNKKILVIEEVEDNTSLRKVLHEKFVDEGLKVLEAKNGEEGLAVALSHHPDLILLDLIMPKMDGVEMLKKLRQDPESKNTPVIVFTNLDSNKKVAEVVELDMYDYLIKSDWTLEELIVKIKQKLGA